MPVPSRVGLNADISNVTTATIPTAAISILTLSRGLCSLTAAAAKLSNWKLSLRVHPLHILPWCRPDCPQQPCFTVFA